MGFLSRIRTGGLRLPFLFLGIGLCVLLWGLRYKLSLYDPPHAASRNIPVAKLLSRDDLPEMLKPPVDGANAAFASRRIPVDLLCCILAVLVLPIARAASPLTELRMPTRYRMLECAGLYSFFFRPPPAILRGLSWSR